jgi:predicted Zn-dependent peptidase
MRTISAKANQLNQYYVQTGDTDYIAKDLNRFMSVTTQSITDAAKGLGKGRVVLHIGPADEDTSTEEPATEKEGK